MHVYLLNRRNETIYGMDVADMDEGREAARKYNRDPLPRFGRCELVSDSKIAAQATAISAT